MSSPFAPPMLSATSPSLPHTTRSASPNYFAFPVDSNTTTIDANGSPKTKQWGSIDAGVTPSTEQGLRPAAYLRKSFTAPSDQKSTISLSSLAFPLSLPGQTPRKESHKVSPSLSASSSSTSTPGVDISRVTPPEERTRTPKSPKRTLSSDSTTIDEVFRRGLDGSPKTKRTNSHEGSLSSVSSAASLRRTSQNASPPKRLDLDRRSSSKTSIPKAGPPESMHTVAQLIKSLALSPSLLVLDLRVSTQYAKAHVQGALNLCVPTTLLKRPSYTVEKLTDTFNSKPDHKTKFEHWRQCSHIVVYDSAAAHVKDSPNCSHIVKKFEDAHFKGQTHIIAGGFEEFEQRHSDLIETLADEDTYHACTGDGHGRSPSTAVIGGCPLPETDNAANPFFSNIRQNTDLIGGVGQLPVRNLARTDTAKMPRWLAKASREGDNGKSVADKFLHIEKREQRRLQDALCTKVKYDLSCDAERKMGPNFQIAGIEKGAKNRYNNIWPFEHSRVRLQNTPNHSCDYVNASFIGTQHSRKKYISTQAPLPATFPDFWSMVWQRGVAIIVMLTAESEGGQVKAHNYWKDGNYGPIKLRSISETRKSLDLPKVHRRPSPPHAVSQTEGARQQRPSSLADGEDQQFVTIRKFTMTHDKHPFDRMREVTQIHYSDWPDFGATAHPSDVLGLVEHCNSIPSASSQDSGQAPKPVLVHCSAGCGRTGTFCTIDTVVDLLKQQKQHQASTGQAGHRQSFRETSPMDTDTPPPRGHRAGKTEPDGWLDRDDIDLIEETVEELRHQRISMVQSLRQYVLCYESILEWVARN